MPSWRAQLPPRRTSRRRPTCAWFLLGESSAAALPERPAELGGEGAARPVVCPGHLEQALQGGELAGRLHDLRLAGEAEELAGVVAAARGARDDLERDRAGGAFHRAGAGERDARPGRRIAGADARDLPGADQRSLAGAVRSDGDRVVGLLGDCRTGVLADERDRL